MAASNATLPLIGTPSIDFFDRVELVALALVVALLVAAMCMGSMMSYLLLLSFYGNCISRTPGCVTGDCCRCMKTVLLFVGRLLCVRTFPALFKMHKTRSGHGNQTRVFMVFLDREVERSLPFVLAFCSIVFGILCASTVVFFRYFPVELSGDCLDKDSHG